MFRLRIRHRTTYRYSQPVQFGRHRVVLRPREGHDLRIVSLNLDIQPAHHVTWARDVHGNSLALVDFDQPAAQLEFINDVVIERQAHFPARHFHEPAILGWPVQYPAEEQAVVDAYRTLSFAADAAPVQQWLDTIFAAGSTDAEAMMCELCAFIHREITYRRRNEKGVQSPAQTIALRSGSCRDMATLLMDAARLLGVASRFASGYLHGSASLAGRASTHAWTEVYLPVLGWRGLDPTVGKETGLRHIATGVSQHPRGVMPITGTYNNEQGGSFLGLDVEVMTTELD
ncbi:MAG: transglutaminase family protein [Steroidobacteraceae bacterium]